MFAKMKNLFYIFGFPSKSYEAWSIFSPLDAVPYSFTELNKY